MAVSTLQLREACALLLAPVVTEKAVACSEYNRVVFKVRVDARKPDIRRAVERLFNVEVVKVHTLRQRGKRKNFRGRAGARAEYKKAMVTLKAGQRIDVSEGIKAG